MIGNNLQATASVKRQPTIKVADDKHFDFLVIGSGVAGGLLALRLSQLGSVAVICKETLSDTNTHWAQGGIASVLHETDSFEKHIQDTLIAGAGICHEDVVKKVVHYGPNAIQTLVDLGVPFDQFTTSSSTVPFHLTQEGGHSDRRILHVNDSTGKAIQTAITHQLRHTSNISIFEYHTALDLIVSDKVKPNFARNEVLGCYILNEKEVTVSSFIAKATFLATGGHGKLYLYTSNPDIATGDGLAMAWRAGASVANLEFMQFHPTCLYHPLAKNFLITEALRGEGGILKSKSGKRFMTSIDPRAELAPRDIVARAIDSEMKKSGEDFVYLDVSHLGSEKIQKSFPGIYSKCLEFGIDITRDPIPVVPAAHYSCGGVITDENGRTNIHHLWALGEVACTGLHGANRLASNSLLEGIAFSEFVYQDVLKFWPELQTKNFPFIPQWQLGKACEPDELVLLSQFWDEIRRTMWNYVGILRTDKRLALAHNRINQILEEIESYYWDIVPSRELIETRNLATVASLTIKCARLRKESRGIHFSLDYPTSDESHFKKDTVLS